MTKEKHKTDIYEETTAAIIELIESGVFPWECPWVGNSVLPSNWKTKNEYNGINTLILWLSAYKNGFDSSQWLTYKQASEEGGQVRKGSKGTPIIFYNMIEKNDSKTKEKKVIPIARRYTVFNCSQIDGLQAIDENSINNLFDIKKVEEANSLIAKIPFKLTHTSQKAYFSPTKDFINMPSVESFKLSEGYYSTIFHELVHWTGHADRLNRTSFQKFSEKENYAFEELVAEIGAAFLCAHFNIDYLSQHASYIDSWLSVLKKDNRAIFKASTLAKKAVEFLLGFRSMDCHLKSEDQAQAVAPTFF